jgi:hypothetical protein
MRQDRSLVPAKEKRYNLYKRLAPIMIVGMKV